MPPVLQIVLLTAAAAYFAWLALAALRSGSAWLYVRYNRDRIFSRRANPAAYWTVVGWYCVLAAVLALGVVLRLLWL
ncbi:MAG TPA: hypothetical protein VKT73_11075 [Xanthobacteraceae bacterium]|nr:hypothetical protein [Xanthobacteraceae bacterium]